MSKIVGIDLGTTNSLVAYMEGGVPRVIRDASGNGIVPSVVAFDPKGLVVGGAAKQRLTRQARQAVYSVKRLMGKGLEDVREELKYFPVPIGERATEGGKILSLRIGERDYTAPEVSALILGELKKMAEAHLGEAVSRAVITVPAYFNDSQRQATKDAGRIAGLEVVRIINEPTSACLAYGLQKKKEGIIAVYDLGGGTFDISILKVKDGIFEVLATNGITHLGGDDLDRKFMDFLIGDIRARGEGAGDPETVQRIRLAAEEAKCRLSSEDRVEVAVSPGEGASEYRRSVTRAELEDLVRDLVNQTVGPCRQALKDAGLEPKDVDEVVLVGGSTRMPLIQETVRTVFGKEPHSELNPDEVVALGAAVQADILAGGTRDLLLLDVTPLSLGLETMGGVVNVLIPRNTTIPTTAKELFTTYVDGQTNVDIHVLQGERELAKDNRSLARFQLKGIDPVPAGIPRIEVSFTIDANGILNVSAREQRSGKVQSVEVKPAYGLTDGEVERMIEESYRFARNDVEARMVAETRTEAATLIHHVERALAKGGHLVDRSEADGIRTLVSRLKAATETEDHKAMRGLMDDLERETRHLAEVLMNATLQESLQGKSLSDLP